MIKNNDWIKKLDDYSLQILLNENEIIEKTPESLNKKINSHIENINKERNIFKKVFFINPSRIVFAASFLFVIFLTVYSIFIFKDSFFINRKNLISNVQQLKGKTFIKQGDSLIKMKNKYKVQKGDIIESSTGSKGKLRFSNNSSIKFEDNTQLKILEIKKDINNDIIELYLYKGKIICNAKLNTKESVFKIYTDTGVIEVIGTIFTVSVLDNNDVIIRVKKGKVWFGNYIKNNIIQDDIKILDNDINLKLKELQNKKIIINENDEIKIQKENIELINNNYKELVNNILLKLNKEKLLKKANKQMIIKEISDFEKVINNIIKDNVKDKKEIKTNKENLSDDNSFIIKKISRNISIKLDEKYTAITTDGDKNIFITSDSNKSIYCIDSINGNLVWKFYNKDIKKITSAAVFYKQKIIFSTPDRIFVLNVKGELEFEKKIDNGPIYWPSSAINNGILYIPINGDIFSYNGIKFIDMEEILPGSGQIYLSVEDNNIYYTYLNEKRINLFSLNEKKIIKKSEEFFNRIFIQPTIIEKYIFLADYNNYIYRLNKNLDNIKSLEIKTGITSNIVAINNNLYFVGIDGCFYEVEYESFEKYKKICQVDKNPFAEKYFTKKILYSENCLYFSSDNGKLFYYDILSGKYEFIEIDDNNENLPLIGSPVKLDDSLFISDKKMNIYSIKKK